MNNQNNRCVYCADLQKSVEIIKKKNLVKSV